MWGCEIGIVFDHQRIIQSLKAGATREVSGMLPPKKFEMLMLWNPILVFWEDNFCLKSSEEKYQKRCENQDFSYPDLHDGWDKGFSGKTGRILTRWGWLNIM